MPGGDALNLGPFSGGLNNRHHPAQIQDNECQELVNFEVDTDGSLRSRPPIRQATAPASIASRFRVIFSGNIGSNFAGYAIASSALGVHAWDGTSWTLISAEPDNAVTAEEYQDAGVDYVWVPVPPPNPGGDSGVRWNPDTGATLVVSMPQARVSCVYKDRLWLTKGLGSAGIDAQRLWFSKVGDFKTWPATNFIDINPGDGQPITNMAVIDDNLVIFKNRSTWVFGFDTNPADGILRVITEDIGAYGLNCVCQRRGSTFVFSDKDVYEIVDFQFTRLNNTVIFDDTGGLNPIDDHYIWTLEDRVIVRTDSKMYSFNILTRTWSEFSSGNSNLNTIGRALPFYKQILTSDHSARALYYMAGSCVQLNLLSYRWYPEVDGTTQEATGTTGANPINLACSMRTKNFSFDLWHTFKRLFWWGVEVYSSFATTGQGDVQAVGYNTVSTVMNLVNGRRFFKLKGAIRFRLVNFKVALDTGGHYYVKLFYIVPVLKAPKETAVKAVNP